MQNDLNLNFEMHSVAINWKYARSLRTDTANTEIIDAISGIDSIIRLAIFGAKTSPNITRGRRANTASE